jgi:hypothetical protein
VSLDCVACCVAQSRFLQVVTDYSLVESADFGLLGRYCTVVQYREMTFEQRTVLVGQERARYCTARVGVKLPGVLESLLGLKELRTDFGGPWCCRWSTSTLILILAPCVYFILYSGALNFLSYCKYCMHKVGTKTKTPDQDHHPPTPRMRNAVEAYAIYCTVCTNKQQSTILVREK